MSVEDGPQKVDMGLAHVSEITIRVADAAGEGFRFADADWAESRIVMANGDEIKLGVREAIEDTRTYKTPPISFRYGCRPSHKL